MKGEKTIGIGYPENQEESLVIPEVYRIHGTRAVRKRPHPLDRTLYPARHRLPLPVHGIGH